MTAPMLLALLATFLSARALAETGPCQNYTLDFILLEGDATSALIEAEIKEDLAEVGITVNTRFLAKDDFNPAMTSGDFNLCFTETWGAPYDPHSYAAAMFVDDEAHYPAIGDQTALKQKVYDVLKVEDRVQRQAAWTDILQDMHGQAISMPMWSRRMPAVINNRLSGYAAGWQQYEYPMHTIQINDGSSTTVRVAAGSQQGLFGSAKSIPRNDPHSYRPNEFFINNWIYEGLVAYDATEPEGIVGQLATSWANTDLQGGGQEWRFTLRSGVKFHDGADCDCQAIKLTFDHAMEANVKAYAHDWYQLPAHISSWACDGETFVLTLTDVYYPVLQELTYIRPIRVLSPNCYAPGDATTNNSCPVDWDSDITGTTCGGVTCVAGTGPWKYVNHTPSDGRVAEMRFAKHTDWWGTHGSITDIVVVGYTSEDDVKADLLRSDGTLDAVVGGGALTPAQVREFEQMHADDFYVKYGAPAMNALVVINANRAPTDDLQLRKVINHAIHKADIVDEIYGGSVQVADSLFPKDMPYCDVDLTPRWDYDLEKAKLLNCPVEITDAGGDNDVDDDGDDDAADDDDDNLPLILGLTLGIGIPVLLVASAAAFFLGKKSAYKELDGSRAAAGAGAGAAGAGEPSVVGNAA